MKRWLIIVDLIVMMLISSCSASTTGASLSNDEGETITATQIQQITAAIQVGQSLERINNQKMGKLRR